MPFEPEQKASYKGLNRESDWLEKVLQCSPVGLAIVSGDGQILFENQSFSTEWAQGRSSRQHLRIADLVHPQDHDALADLLACASRRAKQHSAELRFLTGADGFKWGLASLNPALSENGGNACILVLQITDISVQKDREFELTDRERRWNNALVSSSSGVWDQNILTGEMYYSDTWRAIRGLSPDDKIATDIEEWLESVHPDDRKRVMHSIERQNAGDPEYAVFEYRERHKSGHWVWIECRGACVEWTEDGTPARIVGTDTDISERKAAEERLLQISRRLKVALEVSNVGVYEADFETRQVDWDERMFSIYGVEVRPSVEIGGLWEKLLHPEDAERVLTNITDHVRNLTPFTNEYRVILDDGDERFIRSRALPFIDANGHRKMIGANWDITADIRLQQELEHAKTLAEARNRELEAAKSRIEYNALHDYLTDLPNRRYLDETLERLAGECTDCNSGIGILHIDLDRFKQINDTLGHRAGDMMLKHVARILKQVAKDDEFVARIGGDEFLLAARFSGSRAKLSNLADNLIDELRKPVMYDGHDCRFGASIGIACNTGPDIDAKQLLLNADIALYHAKNHGRNRFAFFSEDSQNQLINIKRISDDLLRALERDEFIPHYQLQFDTRTLDIRGVETLARWQHPERGLLTPDRFLSIAEDLDIVSAIDAVILEKAVADFDGWRRAGLHIPKVSVNVSSRRLHDPSLPQKIRAMAIEPGTLSFELLESIFLDDCDAETAANLAALRELGINVEIDDFGTGHASIISLLKLNPRALKIDRQLIKSLPQSPEQRKLVGSIIEIGRSLDIRVIAEGVETQEHVHILRELGCDELQGYALALPMACADLHDFVASSAWRCRDNPVLDLQADIRCRIN